MLSVALFLDAPQEPPGTPVAIGIPRSRSVRSTLPNATYRPRSLPRLQCRSANEPLHSSSRRRPTSRRSAVLKVGGGYVTGDLSIIARVGAPLD